LPQSAMTEENLSQDMIKGTPGEVEKLDPSYRLMNGAKEWEFFVIGRVFQMLFIQNASETVSRALKGVSLVEYGGRAYARISRFVIVEPKRDRHYSNCIPISTYGYQATENKSASEQREHGIIYTGNQIPEKLPGERALFKDAIKVIAADASKKLKCPITLQLLLYSTHST